MILAIDPGNIESAFVVLDRENLKPVEFDKVDNRELLKMIKDGFFGRYIDDLAIEMIAHYGKDMNAGKSVFDTCVWIGIFKEAFSNTLGVEAQYVYRKDEKINLCGSMKAKDKDIIRALIDRFAQFDLKRGKGTKKNPDWFYGLHADIWQACAVGVTYHDMNLKK